MAGPHSSTSDYALSHPPHLPLVQWRTVPPARKGRVGQASKLPSDIHPTQYITFHALFTLLGQTDENHLSEWEPLPTHCSPVDLPNPRGCPLPQANTIQHTS